MASSLLLVLLCSLILLPISVVSQTRSKITIGDSLNAGGSNSNSPWVVSPSGEFAFGFLQLKDTDLFLLSTWYAKIPEKTIVWFADKGNPAPRGSKVELTGAAGLVLTSPSGEQLWSSEGLISGDGVSYGVLNDTGNFVLEDGSSSTTVWESFKDPRDTLLPSQVLEKGGKLSSRLIKDTDFSKGKFEAKFQNDGNLVMYALNLPSWYVNEEFYYESRTTESSNSSPGTKLIFDRTGDLYVLKENNETFKISDEESTVSTNQFYLRATLDFDGVFALYQYPKNSTGGGGGWTQVWSQPDNICNYVATYGSGICGFNSYCTLGDDKRPKCQCPKRYSLLDPNDPYGSCKPDFIQGCAEDELSDNNDLYDFEVLINTDWPISDFVLQTPFTEEQCRNSCMEDCLCSVAIFRLGDHCWKKKIPLSNGRVDATLDAKAFLKVRKDNSSFVVPPILVPTTVTNNKKTLVLVGSVLFGSSAFLNLVLIVAICFSTFFIFMYKKKLRKVNTGSGVELETNLRYFTYNELEEATNGFVKELGRGTFGVVYEGALNMGTGTTTRVAVKKLNTFLLEEVHKEFENELNAIGLTHHKNLVRLLGFHEAGSERLLVYEYISNGTLSSFLFNGGKGRPSWKLRLQIAIEIARGLVYLHEECGTKIIHCDIKPQNILLDDSFNARICDFGLAKLLKMNQSRTKTAIRGTKGYVALEWFKNMPVTALVDVYSYGVVLLEIICCRRNVEAEFEDEAKVILTDWAYDCYRDGDLLALVEGDQEALEDEKNLEKLVKIAIWCVQEDPGLRPTMRTVTHMLEGIVQVQVPPCPSPISIQYSLDY